MADFNARSLGLLCLALLAAAAARAAAPLERGTVVLDAQSLDLTLDNVVYRRVHITQGDVSISADQGQGQAQGQANRKSKEPDFNNSLWVFRGNVKISLAGGKLSANEAQITFYHQQLTRAVATGSPATFEERVAKTGRLAHGTSDSIDFDVDKGVVHLLNDAYLTDGQYEFRGSTLKYNVNTQATAAESTDPGSQQIHIVVPPPPAKP